jgi:hypothetical protein
MTDPTAFVEEILAMWTNPDLDERLDVIRSHLTTDIRLHDLDGTFEGEAELERFSASLRARFPGARFHPTTPPDIVGDGMRVTWTFGPDAHPDAVSGMDFILWDGTRARAIYAFVTRPPSP